MDFKAFYVRHFFFLGPHLLLFFFLDFDFLEIGLFLLGYSWCLVGVTPTMKSKVQTRKYKYSFLRFTYCYQYWAQRIMRVEGHPIGELLCRILAPGLLITSLLLLFQVQANGLYSIWGGLVCEVGEALAMLILSVDHKGTPI